MSAATDDNPRPWRERWLEVRSQDPDVRRRGAILIRVCTGLIVFPLVVIGPTALAMGRLHELPYMLASTTIGGLIFFGALMLARHAQVVASAWVVTLGFCAVLVGTFLFFPAGMYFLTLLAFSTLLFGMTTTWVWIVAVTLFHVFVTLALSGQWWPQTPPPMPQDFVVALLVLHVFSGSASVAIGLSTRKAFRDLLSARAEAERANQAKSVFLANMTHELRTPLTSVLGYAELVTEELLDEGRAPDAQILRDMGHVEAAGRHLLSMISDVLDLSKVEAGRLELDRETFALGGLLEELELMCAPLFATHDNTLHLEIPGPLGEMRSDRTRVRQILFNLLSNAAKFTHQGSVTLTARRLAGDTLEVLVADTGIGMSAEALARVFDAFVQAERSTTRDYGGTGLGLALTRQLCERLGGSISATSEPGVGSTFRVLLPADTEPAMNTGAHK
jgi:signal transduction histidine kinase